MSKQSPLRIGIIGGAGPMAGALMFQEIISILQNKYQCQRDADFPIILHLSYPFEDMLTEENRNSESISSQLGLCLAQLKQNGVEAAIIACNTLHIFLKPEMVPGFTLVHIIEVLQTVVGNTSPLVLCSTTSAKLQLHRGFFPCHYPVPQFQNELERLINKVLAGTYSAIDSKQLAEKLNRLLINGCLPSKIVVLGCTEFSVLNDRFPLHDYGLEQVIAVVDANKVAAEKICTIIQNRSQSC